MNRNGVIIIAEADDKVFSLIQRGLQSAGIHNTILRFLAGADVLDFLFRTGSEHVLEDETQYLMFLDADIEGGLEVVEKVKQHDKLKKLPVVILGQAQEDMIERCHRMGCSIFLDKLDKDENFMNEIKTIGLFLSTVEIPQIITAE